MLTVASSFAALICSHVAIVYGLFGKGFGWRALIPLGLPPLAPYWAIREQMRGRAILWLASLIAYGIGVLASMK